MRQLYAIRNGKRADEGDREGLENVRMADKWLICFFQLSYSMLLIFGCLCIKKTTSLMLATHCILEAYLSTNTRNKTRGSQREDGNSNKLHETPFLFWWEELFLFV